MNKNKKIFISIIILIVVVIVIIAGYLLSVQRGNVATTPSNTASTQYQKIQNDNDLNTAASDLNNTDTGQINTQLKQLSSDASTF